MDQWVYWLTKISSGGEVTSIYWIITVLPGTNKNDRRSDPDINSWVQPVKELKYLLENICNLKESLVFCPYRWPDGMKEFSGSGKHKWWKDCNRVIHNTYHGGHIKTDHHFI